MKTIKHTVKDPSGIHARPAGVLVSTAKRFTSEVTLIFDDRRCSLKRIFAVMGMSIGVGDSFMIEVLGDDEEECAAALQSSIDESGI